MSKSSEYASFWEHLDELRSRLIRMLILLALVTVVAFLLKEQLFNIVLAPRSSDFVTYRLMGVSAFSIQLINTGLTEQFMVHMRTAMFTGLLVTSPYIIYELFRFVSPGLYDNERRYAFQLVGSAYVMFVIGLLLNYFLIFPTIFLFV